MIFRLPAALLLVIALSSVVAFIVVGQAFANTHRLAPTPARYSSPPAAKGKDAKKLYKQYCVKCHGSDGAGETTFGEIVGATDFTDSEWQKRVDDQRLVNSMIHGRGQMPSFGKKLSKEQITALLVYVRAFKK